MQRNVIYIAGPMTGLPDFGRQAFADAEQYLRRRGLIVINPACLPTDLPGTAYMPICLAMLQQADAVVMLPGWEDSPGARLERAFAEKCGKSVEYLDAFLGAEEVEI